VNFFEKILSIDYTSSCLSSIEQLIFIKISYNSHFSLDVSAKALCDSCGCSKPTLHLSISRLELLNFITVVRSPGLSNKYFVNTSFVNSLFSDFVKAKVDLDSKIDEWNSFEENNPQRDWDLELFQSYKDLPITDLEFSHPSVIKSPARPSGVKRKSKGKRKRRVKRS